MYTHLLHTVSLSVNSSCLVVNCNCYNDQPYNTIIYLFLSVAGTGYRTVLKQAAVPIINRNTCNSQQWLAGDVTNNMFCAGYPDGVHDGCEVTMCHFICSTFKQTCVFVPLKKTSVFASCLTYHIEIQ